MKRKRTVVQNVKPYFAYRVAILKFHTYTHARNQINYTHTHMCVRHVCVCACYNVILAVT